MHRIVETFAKLVKLAALGSLALTALGTAGCYDDLYGEPAYYPPDSFMATEDPIYYDGQAMYLYGGLWYYRNGGGWSYYRSEPAYLRQYRAAHPGYGVRGRGARGVVRGGGFRGGGSRGGGHGGRR